jgi:hypothetical protein
MQVPFKTGFTMSVAAGEAAMLVLANTSVSKFNR